MPFRLSDHFRTLAAKLDKEIMRRRFPRPAKGRAAAALSAVEQQEKQEHERDELARLELVSYALRGLAERYDAGAVPDILRGIRDRQTIEVLLTFPHWSAWHTENLPQIGIKAETYFQAHQAMTQIAQSVKERSDRLKKIAGYDTEG